MNGVLELRVDVKRGSFRLSVDQELSLRGITAIVGPSGSGKTTLLRAIAGLDHHQGAVIKFADQVWQSASGFMPVHKRHLGYVFQESALFPHLSVIDNIRYGANRRMGKNTAANQRLVSDAIEVFELQDLLARSPMDLSGGEKQRVSLARTVASAPKLLLLDEPLASVDVPRKRQIMSYLKRLRSAFDIPMLYVSHSPFEIARLADELMYLEQGAVKAKGKFTEIISSDALPFASGEQSAAYIDATVISIDKEYSLCVAERGALRLNLVGHSYPIGSKLRIKIAASDVSISLAPLTETSVLNSFHGTINEINSDDHGQVLLRVSVSNSDILARISLKSCTMLALSKGKQVWLNVKGVAIVDWYTSRL